MFRTNLKKYKKGATPLVLHLSLSTHTITTPTHIIALSGSNLGVEEQIGNFGGFVPLKD